MINSTLSDHALDGILAQEILGNDFISPMEIAVARSLTYSEEQVAELECSLPNKETLEWLLRNNHMLVAGSPSEMSLLDVHRLRPSYFYPHYKEGKWYTDPRQTFARTEKVTCRWYMTRKGIVPRSTSKWWGTQQKLLSDLETVPTAVELVWPLGCYKAVRGMFLLENLCARTSSVDSVGRHVFLGDFGGEGLYVYKGYDNGPDPSLGVASARRLPAPSL